MVEQVVVGIDVSKAKLDVALLPGGEQFTVSNDRHGIGELLRRVRPLAPSRVVLEATGKLEQLAVSELAAAGLPVVIINQHGGLVSWFDASHAGRRSFAVSAQCLTRRLEPADPTYGRRSGPGGNARNR